jgi:hypothetical protein
MAQVVSCRTLTAEAWIYAWYSLCGICHGHSGNGTGSSLSSLVFSVIVIHHGSPYSYHLEAAAQRHGLTPST